MRLPGAPRRVAITGVGVVGTPFTGGREALDAALGAPSGGRATGPDGLGDAMEGVDTRRLSRVCQLAVAAARLAARDAGGDPAAPLGVVVGTELGDLHSTREFADGYRARGPGGLSALLFPGTVMNTMAAATSIALQARDLSLTINALDIPGELAIARAAASIAAGRADRLLAGGVDELDPYVVEILGQMRVSAPRRSEGAAFVMLEGLDADAVGDGRALGEILGVATGALPARPRGVGRTTRSPVIAAALRRAGRQPSDVAWIYPSAGDHAARDAWERAVLETALAPHRPPRAAPDGWGQHAGLGALRVAAAAWTARSGLLPTAAGGPSRVGTGVGLVHGLARGGGQAALVVGPPPVR